MKSRKDVHDNAVSQLRIGHLEIVEALGDQLQSFQSLRVPVSTRDRLPSEGRRNRSAPSLLANQEEEKRRTR